MKKDRKQFLYLFFLLFFPSVFYVLLSTGKQNFIQLPYFGQKEILTNGDTSYHTIPSFQFIDQEGKKFTDKNLEGKIYVANFFFTTCKSICPEMSSQLIRIQERFADANDVEILSHTVDPENDSVSALKEYALKYKAGNKWHFVTGNKKEIYDIARNGYMVNALENTDTFSGEAFLHSQLFILIDKEKHIRSIQDGTSTADVDSLIDDINVLRAAYAIKNTSKENVIQKKTTP